MRGQRSKQYRKLVAQYQMAFGFREPYQILVDSEIIKDCHRQKMDLVGLLRRTLHAKEIKPMVTQCCMRHLYAQNKDNSMRDVITYAQNEFERGFCGHHPDKYPEPLSAADCLHFLVDGKDTGRNPKHYVVATQDQDVRRFMRSIKGVPLIFERRGVVIMEPMADISVQEKMREELMKYRVGLKKVAGEKRKREAEDEVEEGEEEKKEKKEREVEEEADGEKKKKKKKKNYGRKQPNPLAVKKTKKPVVTVGPKKTSTAAAAKKKMESDADKKKRKRRKKAAADGGDGSIAALVSTPAPAVTVGDA